MALRLPTTIWGTQDDGTLFVEQTRTLDISPTGARLAGVNHGLRPGTILGLQHGSSTGRFRVVWVGATGSRRAGQIGVACVEIGQTVVRTLLYIHHPDYGLDRHRKTLESAGYKVVCTSAVQAAESAESAFDAAIIEHPVANCDLSGLVYRLREINHAARVVLLSSHPASVPEFAMQRIDALLHKGVRAQELLARMEELVGPGTQVKWPITRFSHRYPVTAPVRVRLVRRGQTSLFDARTNDLSEEGASLSLAADVLPGEIVSLAFKLPTAGRDFCIYGTVRHRSGDEYGIEFLDLSEEQRDAIRNLCQVLPPLTSPKT